MSVFEDDSICKTTTAQPISWVTTQMVMSSKGVLLSHFERFAAPFRSRCAGQLVDQDHAWLRQPTDDRDALLRRVSGTGGAKAIAPTVLMLVLGGDSQPFISAIRAAALHWRVAGEG